MAPWKRLALALTFATYSCVSGQGLFQPVDQQCVGKFFDVNRLESLEKESVASLVSGSFARDGQAFDFLTQQVNPITSAGESLCRSERHRVREAINGIPIFGADIVVTVDSCSGFDQSVSFNTNTLASMDISTVRAADGNFVSSVDVPTGYSTKRSKDEAIKMVADLYQVAKEMVTTITMEIYPTEDQDYRAWIATVLVDTTPGEPQLYQTVVDDENEEIILQCEIAGLRQKAARSEMIRRRLQDEGSVEPLDPELCNSCATRVRGIVWDESENVECDATTLYLDNADRKTLCYEGTDADNNTYFAPGPVQSLHWGGTTNCDSGTDCSFWPTPECPDAINDIQWGAINFLQYMQSNFGMMGGLVKNDKRPQVVSARAHYEKNYCNAFFLPGENTVTFGDCDCNVFGPLVSTDVVVHEIVHGFTQQSSGLVYFLESGGLNEAYSDIMACALEFTVEDTLDTPDFTVGESLAGEGLGRGFLRHMEFPSKDGNSIDTICDYEHAMDVHYSSGFLNRAYVNSVRACEATCGETAECAMLMADAFMYANLNTITMCTGFQQAAVQTCREIEDYFLDHSPQTNCTVQETRLAVLEGFAAVGLKMEEDSCRAKITCKQKGILEQTWDAFKNGSIYALILIDVICQVVKESCQSAFDCLRGR